MDTTGTRPATLGNAHDMHEPPAHGVGVCLEHEEGFEVARDNCKKQSAKHVMLGLDAMIFTANMIHFWPRRRLGCWKRAADQRIANFTATYYVLYHLYFSFLFFFFFTISFYHVIIYSIPLAIFLPS